MFCGRNVLVTDVLLVVMYYYGLVLTVYTLGGKQIVWVWEIYDYQFCDG